MAASGAAANSTRAGIAARIRFDQVGIRFALGNAAADASLGHGL
jgi:hypothetical protein